MGYIKKQVTPRKTPNKFERMKYLKRKFNEKAETSDQNNKSLEQNTDKLMKTFEELEEKVRDIQMKIDAFNLFIEDSTVAVAELTKKYKE